MKKLTPYYAYRIYFSIREHYNARFNIAEYKWSFLNPRANTFESWKGRGIFEILANEKIKSVHQWITMLIVIFFNDRNANFETIFRNFEAHYIETQRWESHICGMPHTFNEEMIPIIDDLLRSGKSFDSRFPAWLMDQFAARKMCVETFIIMKKILKLDLDGNANYEYLYRDQYEKYEVLLNISMERYRKQLITIINNTKERLNYEQRMKDLSTN